MASVRTRNGKHTGLFRDSAGMQKSAGTFPTKAQALTAAKKAEKRGTATQPKSGYPAVAASGTGRGTITVGAYATTWLAGIQIAAGTYKVYGAALRKRIIPKFGSVALKSVTHRQVRDWFRELSAANVSSQVIAKVRAVGSSMYAAALDEDPPLADVNPFAGHKISNPPKEVRRLTEPEFATLLAAIEPGCRGQYRLLLRTAVETGMRFGELNALAPDDIVGNAVIVRHSRDLTGAVKTPKNGKQRRVPISTVLADELRTSLPFQTDRGRHLDNSDFLYRVWGPARDKAGLGKDVKGLHVLRHTFISHLFDRNINPVVIRDLAGHSSLVVTNRYAHTARGAGDAAVAAMSGFGTVDQTAE